MDFLQRYIDKQDYQYSNCLDEPGKCSTVFVVIPCFNEPNILTTLLSLADCYPPVASVSVLVVVNDAENSPEEVVAQNILTLKSIEEWNRCHQFLFFDVQRIYAHSLPQKWAGVGWARKIGMDEAIKQLAKNRTSDGIIISLDADCTVLPNYLQAVETAFTENPQSEFFTIYFEHPFDNQELSALVQEGIIRYELHMRYYRNALQWSGYPHAIHTVGSSFALRASAYVKQGGMNRRKAGEDFYFLHKLVLLGQYGTISTTTVFPSPRQSDRVPFGTGAAIKKWITGDSLLNSTYSLEAFGHLRPLFAHPAQLWYMKFDEISDAFGRLHPSLQTFCKNSQTLVQLSGLQENCSNPKVFEKRFFHLFNAFWILKYLNFVHETTLNRADLHTETLYLLHHIGIIADKNILLEKLLKIYQALDKEKGR